MKTLLLLVCLFAAMAQKIFINMDQLSCQVDKRFLSFTVDASEITQEARGVDFSNDALVAFTKALSPSYLRIGGTQGMCIFFKAK